jgi:DNA-binding transcriptional ArsR family regulator
MERRGKSIAKVSILKELCMNRPVDSKVKQRKAGCGRVAAMAHPVRAATLRYLHSHGTANPQEVADALGEDVSNVSYHMKRLVELDCAELVSLEPVRGAVKHIYRAVQGHLVETGDWEHLPDGVKQSNVVECGELVFDDFRTALNAGTIGRPDDETFAVIHYPMRGLDREGLKEVVEIAERAYRAAEEVPERCLERMEKSGEEPIRVSFSQLAFEVPHF